MRIEAVGPNRGGKGCYGSGREGERGDKDKGGEMEIVWGAMGMRAMGSGEVDRELFYGMSCGLFLGFPLVWTKTCEGAGLVLLM